MPFALHYAQTYFSQKTGAPINPERRAGRAAFLRGRAIRYWTLTYFWSLIGMTTQTADIIVTSLRMRRLVLFHGLLPFAFNNAIVALSINIIPGLL